ncbi:MAG: hypothetical protein IIA09_18410 [Proteobacteria bacterium]|nr:hypothetical protein [Pseudomonadota bacterium]
MLVDFPEAHGSPVHRLEPTARGGVRPAIEAGIPKRHQAYEGPRRPTTENGGESEEQPDGPDKTALALAQPDDFRLHRRVWGRCRWVTHDVSVEKRSRPAAQVVSPRFSAKIRA